MRRTVQGWSVHDWHDLAPWSHSWDAADPELETYADDGTAWSIAAATRVSTVPDRAGDAPMFKDPGYYGDVFSQPDIPGCLWVSSSARFNNRPCWNSDIVLVDAGFFDNFHSMLTPNATNTAPDFFNIAQPWWGAIFCSPGGNSGNENALLDGDPGMTTMGAEPTLAIQTWNVLSPPDIGGTIDSGITPTAGKALLVMWKVDGASSWLEVVRYTSGAIATVRVTGTQGSDNPLTAVHSGWSHSNYTSALAFASGSPDETDVSRVRAWAAGHLTAAG